MPFPDEPSSGKGFFCNLKNQTDMSIIRTIALVRRRLFGFDAAGRYIEQRSDFSGKTLSANNTLSDLTGKVLSANNTLPDLTERALSTNRTHIDLFGQVCAFRTRNVVLCSYPEKGNENKDALFIFELSNLHKPKYIYHV
jgi:hypothetical protein